MTKEWIEGFNEGVKSVFEYLEMMQKVNNVKELNKEYESWANADEITLPNGNVYDRVTGFEISKLKSSLLGTRDKKE